MDDADADADAGFDAGFDAGAGDWAWSAVAGAVSVSGGTGRRISSRKCERHEGRQLKGSEPGAVLPTATPFSLVDS